MTKRIDTLYAFPGFEGFTSASIIKKHSKLAKADRMPDPVPRVIQILGQPKFGELAVTSFMLKDIEDRLPGEDELARHINFILIADEDPNIVITQGYHSLLMNALVRTLNQGVLNEKKQVNELHVMAAERVVFESQMRPKKTFLDLPSIDQTGGLTDYQRGVNALFRQYDRGNILALFD